MKSKSILFYVHRKTIHHQCKLPPHKMQNAPINIHTHNPDLKHNLKSVPAMLPTTVPHHSTQHYSTWGSSPLLYPFSSAPPTLIPADYSDRYSVTGPGVR